MTDIEIPENGRIASSAYEHEDVAIAFRLLCNSFPNTEWVLDAWNEPTLYRLRIDLPDGGVSDVGPATDSLTEMEYFLRGMYFGKKH